MTSFENYKLDGSIANRIFNAGKADYQASPLFFGEDRGLLDTINMRYPALFKLFEELKSTDWKHNEYKYTECLRDFKNFKGTSNKKHIADKMIRTLAWQWEADSIAGSSVIEIIGPVSSATEIRVGYTRIADNENLHAMTYSEITKGSFENPNEILQEVLSIRQALGRLSVVSEVFDRAMTMVYKYRLGELPYSQLLYNAVMMMIVTLYIMERVQFMQSFAITFGICDTGVFTNIGLAVQLICRDEYTNHVPFNQGVIAIELATDRGQVFFAQCQEHIRAVLRAVYKQESNGVEYLYEDGNDIVGITKKRLHDNLRYNMTAPIMFLGQQDHFTDLVLETNPLPFMNDWINMDEAQQSNQEQHNNQYSAGAVSVNNVGSVPVMDLGLL